MWLLLGLQSPLSGKWSPEVAGFTLFRIFLLCLALRNELLGPLVSTVQNFLSQLWREGLGPFHSREMGLFSEKAWGRGGRGERR